MPLPFVLLKNKLDIFIDGIRTEALVDTGASVSVISLAFKNRLGRKVMFICDRHPQLRGVDGNILRPIGVCSASVLLGKDNIAAEFTVLKHCSHEVILGLDFLRDCGASIDCARGEVSIHPNVMSILIESSVDQNCYLCVSNDFLLPGCSAAFIAVELSPYEKNHLTQVVLVEPLAKALETKNVLVPRTLTQVTNGHTLL